MYKLRTTITKKPTIVDAVVTNTPLILESA